MELLDRLLDGGLAEYLGQRRAQGWSYQRIANELRDEHDADVSDETVRRWVAASAPSGGEAA